MDGLQHGCMDATARLELIRARLGHRSQPLTKPRGLACAETGQPSVAKRYGPVPLDASAGWGCRNEFGVLLNPEDRRAQWVKEPDEKPEQPLRIKRGSKPHHLTTIAEKWLHAPKQRAKVAS